MSIKKKGKERKGNDSQGSSSGSESAMASTPPNSAADPDLAFRTFYKEYHREAIESLKLQLFEGMRMHIIMRCNEKFHFNHSMMVGNIAIPSQLSRILIKTPTINYDFGATYTDSKSMLLAKMTMDGRLSAKFKYDFTHNLALKAIAHLTVDEPHKSHGFINFDYKRPECRFLLQMESEALLGGAFIVNVNPYISFGQEWLWACTKERLPDFGVFLRYHSAKTIATGHFRSNPDRIALSYVHRVCKEVCLASNLMYNTMSKDIIASIGYDCNILEAEMRVRGKIDSNGVVSVLIEPYLGHLAYSVEIDHKNQDYKFGFRLSNFEINC